MDSEMRFYQDPLFSYTYERNNDFWLEDIYELTPSNYFVREYKLSNDDWIPYASFTGLGEYIHNIMSDHFQYGTDITLSDEPFLTIGTVNFYKTGILTSNRLPIFLSQDKDIDKILVKTEDQFLFTVQMMQELTTKTNT
jgi:hypothetical protein